MPHAHPPDVVRALVVVGDVRIPYLAAGRGPAVVLLSDSPAIRAAFLSEPPREVRLLIPDLPTPVDGERAAVASAGAMDDGLADPPGRWLEGFLDALGVADVWVDSDEGSAALMHSFVGVAPDRVRGSRILSAASADGVAPPSIDTSGPGPRVRE